MIERFRLGDVAGRRPQELSGGQRQRCSIARALLGSPRLLLLDEPARGLDAPLRAEFYEVLRSVRASFSTPFLLVTHDLDECFELGEHMLVMRDGRVVQSGPPRQVAEEPTNIEVAKLLGLYNVLAVEIRALDPANKSSRLRFGDQEFTGPYFPGRLKGDRVHIYVRPDQLTAAPRDGKPAPDQIAVSIERAVEMPGAVRLEFACGLTVHGARADYERSKHNKEWVVRLPAAALRILR
jgi:ABC-type sulfate/molybdate transport systems ATPase subunit